MSNTIQDAVRSLVLTPNLKHVLLAYADHAHEDGSESFPSIERIAYETSYDERQVKRIVKLLVEKRLLVPEGHARGGRGVTPKYRVCPENGDKMPSFREWRQGRKGDRMFASKSSDKVQEDVKGDKMPSFIEEEAEPEERKGDIYDTKRVTFSSQKGDIYDASPIRNERAEPSEPFLEPAAAESAVEQEQPSREVPSSAKAAAAAAGMRSTLKPPSSPAHAAQPTIPPNVPPAAHGVTASPQQVVQLTLDAYLSMPRFRGYQAFREQYPVDAEEIDRDMAIKAQRGDPVRKPWDFFKARIQEVLSGDRPPAVRASAHPVGTRASSHVTTPANNPAYARFLADQKQRNVRAATTAANPTSAIQSAPSERTMQ